MEEGLGGSTTCEMTQPILVFFSLNHCHPRIYYQPLLLVNWWPLNPSQQTGSSRPSMTSRRATSPSPSASSLRSDTWNSTESERKSGSYWGKLQKQLGKPGLTNHPAREGLTTLLPVGWALWQQPSGPARWDLMRHTTDLALAIRRYIAVAESAEPIQDAKDSLSACINATVTALQVCDQETGRGQTGEETPAKCAQKYLRIAQCKLEGNALSKRCGLISLETEK